MTWGKNQCSGKQKHWTRSRAKRHKRSIEQASGRRFKVYICELCGYYHVGGMGEARLRGDESWIGGSQDRVEPARNGTGSPSTPDPTDVGADGVDPSIR